MPSPDNKKQRIVVLGEFKGFERKLKVTISKVRSGKVRISVEFGEKLRVQVTTDGSSPSGNEHTEQDDLLRVQRSNARKQELERWVDDGGRGSAAVRKAPPLKFTIAGSDESITAVGKQRAGLYANDHDGSQRSAW